MSPTTYKLDPTHMRLRLALLGVLAVGFIVGLFASIALIDSVLHIPSPIDVVAIPVFACCIALLVSWGAERVLTVTWPSGRTIEVTPEGVTLRERTGSVVTIAWDQRVNILTWHFAIRKNRAWVRKGWYCAACQLKQGDSMIIPYAFLKPEAASALPDWKAFEELLPRKTAAKATRDHPLSDIGEQAQLRYAEQDRWHLGVEMTSADFVQLVSQLRQHVPDWQASA